MKTGFLIKSESPFSLLYFISMKGILHFCFLYLYTFNTNKNEKKMKILKYLLYLIVFLVIASIAFIAVGFIHPTVNYGHEITVNKSIKEAWAVQQDESKFGQWLEGFKSIDLIEGEAGTVGSKYKVVVNPGEGQEDFIMTETVMSVKEFDHMTMNFDSDMMLFDQTTSFTEADGKTTIKTDSKVSGKGMMMRSMFALMERLGGSFHKQEVKNIEALKKVIEENTTDYYPAPVVEEPVLLEKVSE